MNKNSILIGLITISMTLFGCSNYSDVTSAKTFSVPKKVLILGDSISIGYGGYVKDSLASKYIVRRPNENCRNTTYTLEHIDDWLSQHPNNDVITWNNGIWNATSGYKTSVERYGQEIVQIARKLKATGARVIFFTTTPLLPESAPFMDPTLIDKFNDEAKNLLTQEGIEVWDLNRYARGLQYIDGAHFDRSGYKLLASAVAMAILYVP